MKVKMEFLYFIFICRTDINQLDRCGIILITRDEQRHRFRSDLTSAAVGSSHRCFYPLSCVLERFRLSFAIG